MEDAAANETEAVRNSIRSRLERDNLYLVNYWDDREAVRGFVVDEIFQNHDIFLDLCTGNETVTSLDIDCPYLYDSNNPEAFRRWADCDKLGEAIGNL